MASRVDPPQTTQEDPKPNSPKQSKNSPSLLPNSKPSSDIVAIAAQKFKYPSFSELLEGVVKAANSGASSLPPANPLLETVRLKGQFGMSHQEALASVTAKATQMQLPAEFVNSAGDTSPKVKSQVSVPMSSAMGQTKTPSPEIKKNLQEGDKKSSSRQINKSQINKPANDIAKTPNSDGYSWRKYGQKQVKSSESFRSYYRCTHVGCHAKKKVQHPDKSGCIIGVDYKGHHNHDPPTKIKDKTLKMRIAYDGPDVKTDADTLSAEKKLGDSDLSACGKVHEQVMSVDERSEQENSNKCHGTTSTDVEGQNDKKPNAVQRVVAQQLMLLPEEPSRSSETNEDIKTDVKKETDGPSGQKRRLKERARAFSEHTQKSPKQPKVIVHAAGDVGITNDGYRWRKYGQKMVKGNPYPRSYYRCTSAGCPARKHVERATDNSTAMMVTYEGKHDHDKPVPKKRHTSGSTTQYSADSNGNSATEKTAETKGAEKMIESARTLLSIGIELKSC